MFTHYVKRTIKKIISLPLWLIFNLIYLIVKPLSKALRLLSFPGTILAVIVASVVFFNEGFTILTVQILIAALVMALIYAVAPYIPYWVYNAKYVLKQLALRPIVIRPPVRYTVESI